MFSKGLFHRGVIVWELVNSLPIMDWSKLKASAEENLNVNQKLKFASGHYGTLWEKEKMLVTGSLYRGVKIRDHVVKS